MKKKLVLAMAAAMAITSCAVPAFASDDAAGGGKIGISMPTQSLERWNRDGSYLGFFRNYPLLLLYPMYLNFASSNCLPHLPYIVRFIIFNLLLVPSTNPLL